MTVVTLRPGMFLTRKILACQMKLFMLMITYLMLMYLMINESRRDRVKHHNGYEITSVTDVVLVPGSR